MCIESSTAGEFVGCQRKMVVRMILPCLRAMIMWCKRFGKLLLVLFGGSIGIVLILIRWKYEASLPIIVTVGLNTRVC